MKKLVFVFICFLFFRMVFADKIILKNGREMKGIIKEKTDKTVKLDVGFGIVTLNRADIAKIITSTKKSNEEIVKSWKSKYFDNERFVPKRLKYILKYYRDLEELRKKIMEIKAENKKIENDLHEIKEKISIKKKLLVEKNKQLKETDPQKDVNRYNSLVREINSLSADIVLLKNKVNQINEKALIRNEVFTKYLNALYTVKTKINEAERNLSKQNISSEEKSFIENMKKEIERYGEEYEKIVVYGKDYNKNHIVVSALINGSAEGNFIVDTGADIMTLSSDFAKKLGYDVGNLPQVEVILADGKKVKAYSLILKSVSVGGMEAKNIQAVVLDGKNIQVVGLLGMSYLKNFLFQIDVRNKKLILYSFSN